MSAEKTIKIINKFFKKNELQHSFEADRHAFTGSLPTGSALGEVSFVMQVADECVSNSCILPIKATKTNFKQFAELICRINYRLVWGAFRLDSDDGEIRFQYIMSAEELYDDPMEKARKLMGVPQQMLHVDGGVVSGLPLFSSQNDLS